MNAVIAVNNKAIENFIADQLPTVTVLSVIRKRNEVVDSVLNRNPHCLILSPDLTGKTEMREIVSACRKAKPALKIVYLYGDRDNAYKGFLDFLVRNGVYDIVLDEITTNGLKNAILKNAAFDDVSCYLLSKEDADQLRADEEESNPSPEPADEPKTKVLVVEKYIGNITVAVAGLFARTGATHTAIEICKFFSDKRLDAGLVVSSDTYSLLCEYYITDEKTHNIKGVRIYNNLALAKHNHQIVICDLGNIYDNPAKQEEFYNYNFPLLLCSAAPWEIDRLTDFIRDNEFAAAVQYLFYPVSDRTFKELRRNLAQGHCKCYQIKDNPDLFTPSVNDKQYAVMLRSILNEKVKKS